MRISDWSSDVCSSDLQADVMGLTAADAVLAVVPMFHANAWLLPFAAPAVGARLVLPGRHADGERLARLIRDEGVTVAVGVPTVWIGWHDSLEVTGSPVPIGRAHVCIPATNEQPI